MRNQTPIAEQGTHKTHFASLHFCQIKEQYSVHTRQL